MYSKELLKWVNATLHNDEASIDEELIEYFKNNGLTQQEAQNAVNQRNKCLNDIFYEVQLA
jgi:hypothetical protein